MEGPSKESITAAMKSFSRAVDENVHVLSTNNVTNLRRRIEMITDESSNIASEKAVRPWNYTDFQDRLISFKKTSHWFAKPSYLSPWQCARFGWRNSGIDTIGCASCSASIVCLSKYFVLFSWYISFSIVN